MTSIQVTVFSFWIAVFSGWAMNLWFLVANSAVLTMSVAVIMRIVGVFVVPLGSLMGFFA